MWVREYVSVWVCLRPHSHTHILTHRVAGDSPRSSAPKGTRSHTRRRASPRASQSECSCTLRRDNRLVWTAHHRTSCHGKRPRPMGPKRKRCSQNPDAILAGSGCTGLSLRRSRPAAACRLRQSCRRNPPQTSLPSSNRFSTQSRRFSRRQASGSPAVRFASSGRAVCAGLTRRWGRADLAVKRRPGTSRKHSLYALYFVHRPGLARHALPSITHSRPRPIRYPNPPSPMRTDSGFQPLAIIPCLSLSLTLQMVERLAQCTKLR